MRREDGGGFGRIWPCISGGRRREDSGTRGEDGRRRKVARKRAYGLRLTAHSPGSLPDSDLHRQSSVVRPSISRKCASRVIKVRPCCRAIAAIQMSLSGIGRPCLRRASLIAP